VIFVLIAFWTGAGGWIVVMYGALNNIPDEVLEAARIDGAGRGARPGTSRSR
jgi:multiple sugar transport system permease protein